MVVSLGVGVKGTRKKFLWLRKVEVEKEFLSGMSKDTVFDDDELNESRLNVDRLGQSWSLIYWKCFFLSCKKLVTFNFLKIVSKILFNDCHLWFSNRECYELVKLIFVATFIIFESCGTILEKVNRRSEILEQLLHLYSKDK